MSVENEISERRMKIVLFPNSVRVVDVYYDHKLMSPAVVIESASFDPIAKGAELPKIQVSLSKEVKSDE